MVKIFVLRRLVVTVVWGDGVWSATEDNTKRSYFLSLHSASKNGSTTLNFLAGPLAVIAGIAPR